MGDEVRVWEVGSSDELREVCRSKLDLEERIEKWISRDIAVLDPELLVIGEQVETAFGKVIDLLCMDSTGNLVIVELKRDRAPREVVAQALDYASWVKDLELDRIQEIAAKYFKGKDLKSAFVAKFKTGFPDVINQDHAMRIVASEIDDDTERIIRYLSETHSVNINAVRFQFFQATDGRQMLARTFTVALEEAKANIEKRPGKRSYSYTTPEEMEEAASKAGVGNQYRKFNQGVPPCFKPGTTKLAMAFSGKFPNGQPITLFSVVPGESSADRGLRYRLYSKKLADFIHVDEQTVKAHLPPNPEPYELDGSGKYTGWRGYIKSEDDIRKILELLKQGLKAAATA